MNTNYQLPSDIDYIGILTTTPIRAKPVLTLYVKTFRSMTMKMTEESNSRQSLFRLQWLGDWLAEMYGWKMLNPDITPPECYSQLSYSSR